MEEKWINNLRSKMESHVEPEPTGLWDEIDVALNETKSSPIINRRKVVLWSAIGGIAAMLTLIFLLGRQDTSLLTVPTNIERPTAERYIEPSQTEEATNKITQLVDEKKSLLATNTTSYNKEQPKKKKQAIVVISDKEDIPEKGVNQPIEESQKVDEIDSDKRQTASDKKSQAEWESYLSNENKNNELIDNYSYRKRAKNARKLTASLYSSNLPNTSAESNGYGELITKSTLSKQMSASSVEELNPAGDIIFSNMGEETHTKTEHKQPVKAGLSIRYQLNDKFGIESGLTYTYLSSNLTSGTDKNLYETEQSLQYMGIPLNVNYNIWNNKQFTFYVSTGGLVEKLVAEEYNTNYIIDNKIVSTEQKKIKENPLLFSLNSSLGLQVNVSSYLGLFVEPGLGYYIDNGSNIETIYKEKPFNYNLKFGVRVNLK